MMITITSWTGCDLESPVVSRAFPFLTSLNGCDNREEKTAMEFASTAPLG